MANISVAPGCFSWSLKFAAFAFDQALQFIEQLRVVGAEGLYQIGERQRGSIGRPEQLADALQRGDPLQLFGGVARSIAKGASLGDARRADPSCRDGPQLS